jgi:putative hemolysin
MDQGPALEIPWQNDGWTAGWFGSLARKTVERALGMDGLRTLREGTGKGHDTASFIREVLSALRLTIEVFGEELQRIPPAGPLVVVSNHPFGAVDGLALGSLLLDARPDTRLLANFLLARIPELRDLFIQVDPFGGGQATRRNVGSLRAAMAWVRRGGVLGIFPAGAVSHFQPRRGEVTDPPWNASVARMVKATGATVLPVFFGGRNSLLFQGLGLLHPSLRTAMLPREMLKKVDQTIRVRIGAPIPFSRLLSHPKDEEMVTYLRWRTYTLAVSSSSHSDRKSVV